MLDQICCTTSPLNLSTRRYGLFVLDLVDVFRRLSSSVGSLCQMFTSAFASLPKTTFLLSFSTVELKSRTLPIFSMCCQASLAQ